MEQANLLDCAEQADISQQATDAQVQCSQEEGTLEKQIGSTSPRWPRCRWSWGLSVGSLAAALVLLAPAMQVWSGFLPPERSRHQSRSGQQGAESSPGKLVQFWGNGQNPQGQCNISARSMQYLPLRSWDLSPIWRRSCEEKNHKKSLAQERNWCWVGVKRQCHWNLKNHYPWLKLQHMAAKAGAAPPVRFEPFSGLDQQQICDVPEHGRSRKWSAQQKASAHVWFAKMVKVYVLNLPSDVERWQMISARLKGLKMQATRVEGVDMRVRGALWTAKQKGWVPKEFNFSRAQEMAYQPRQEMGSILGTLGCASAHFKVQAQILAERPPLAVVLEDDSWPIDDFVIRLWALVHEELPCDWQITSLYSRCPYGTCVSPRLARVQPDMNEPEWRCRQGVNWGMHAMLYRLDALPHFQQVWRQTVFNHQNPHCMDIDVALASISDKVSYYAVPNVQDPGFVRETNHPSARWSINQAASTTSTSTSFVYVPKVRPGEPWPGAWNFG